MNAKFLLESIQPHMSKTRILGIVQEAIDDLVILDAHQVAAQLGAEYNAVRHRANKSDIGIKMATDGKRVYFPSDVKILRSLVGADRKKGPRDETIKKIGEMRQMRQRGETLTAIGEHFGLTEGYVSRLLKK